MELKKSGKLLITLSFVWAFLLLALGAWWLYLILNAENGLPKGQDYLTMVKWEGGTFFVLLTLISGTSLFLYFKDMKKTRAMQAFFSGLTHELKTPLASIRLQADVISNLIESGKTDLLPKLGKRMIEDTLKLETQMDKILQLSRIEQGGNLNLRPLALFPFTKKVISTWGEGQEVEIDFKGESPQILGDEFALELIFRNLLENSKRYAALNPIKIEFNRNESGPYIQYSDGGVFKGDSTKLGTLFYKFNSSKGSGIGLYLVKRLMSKMGGSLKIHFHPTLKFNLQFGPNLNPELNHG